MSCIIISTDWRFKEKFKNRFPKSFLREFSLAAKLIQSAERGLFTGSDCIIVDEKLGTSSQTLLLEQLQKIHNVAEVILFIDKGHKAPDLPQVDFATDILFKDSLDYAKFFESFEATHVFTEQQDEIDSQYFRNCLIGNSDCMHEVREKLALYSASPCSIHLSGETGTGKEIAANSIHQAMYPARKIVSVNCSLLGGSLGESIFFGHAKGAFTDGRNEVQGLIEEANGSSLFLDEIEDLPLASQANMLRLLETGQYRRLGDPQIRHSSFRLITASNKDLQDLIEKDLIRKDFFYRITDTTIRLPPLREHKQDIRELTEFYLQNNYPGKFFSKEDLMLLELYNWPGNVRQLFSTIKRCVVRSGEKPKMELGLDDFT
jgi:two-component system NtrC family response regulator